MKIIGLTGSIATGKSFIAEIFRKKNIKVFSSDLEVSLILSEKEVIELIKQDNDLRQAFNENALDKEKLSKIVFNNKEALEKLENIVLPFVRKKMNSFIENNKHEKQVLLEIPLLFEKSKQEYCDKIITTICSIKTQTERALRRKNIDKKRLEFIMKQQMSSKKKAELTDYIVYTDISYSFTLTQIEQIFIKEEI